jgi:YD repeat-containing protein
VRVYGNGVRQETVYDKAGRVILIREADGQRRLVRAEGYVYDSRRRRRMRDYTLVWTRGQGSGIVTAGRR